MDDVEEMHESIPFDERGVALNRHQRHALRSTVKHHNMPFELQYLHAPWQYCATHRTQHACQAHGDFY